MFWVIGGVGLYCWWSWIKEPPDIELWRSTGLSVRMASLVVSVIALKCNESLTEGGLGVG